jgi:Acetyltransferase (GNAT) domain
LCERHCITGGCAVNPEVSVMARRAGGYGLRTRVRGESERHGGKVEARAGVTRCANAIFQQPWWLDAVAPGRWGEAAVERDGRVVARLPYVVRGRPRLRMLTMPPLTQTLGPWVERGHARGPRALGDELDLLGRLEAALPRADAFVQQFAPCELNALPFHWAGYRLELQYTYRLTGLQSETALWDGLRGSVRREIRKARRTVDVRDDLALDRFHAVWAKTFARQGLPAPATLEQLARLDAACTAHGASVRLSAHDDAGEVHAVAYVVWDEHAAFYLLGGADPALRTSGASSLLLWDALVRARAMTDVFDFEGSMLAPVERFFRGFGAVQTPYLRVTRATPLGAAALALRSGWRRVRRYNRT